MGKYASQAGLSLPLLPLLMIFFIIVNIINKNVFHAQAAPDFNSLFSSQDSKIKNVKFIMDQLK